VELASNLVEQLLARVHRRRPDLSAAAARALVLRCVREATECIVSDANRARRRSRRRGAGRTQPRVAVPALPDPPPEPPAAAPARVITVTSDEPDADVRAALSPGACFAPMADVELGEQPFGFATHLGPPQEWMLDVELEGDELRRAA
jgi:hypothetical protein